jgi:hypothetical protein
MRGCIFSHSCSSEVRVRLSPWWWAATDGSGRSKSRQSSAMQTDMVLHILLSAGQVTVFRKYSKIHAACNDSSRFVTLGINQKAGDTAAGGEIRQIIQVKPAGIGNFITVNNDISSGILSRKPHHKLRRKRPGLAGDIADVADSNPGFLPCLADGTLLK